MNVSGKPRFDGLRDSYRSAVAFREALVRLSFSAGGSRLLTEKIDAATQAVAQAERALDHWLGRLGP